MGFLDSVFLDSVSFSSQLLLTMKQNWLGQVGHYPPISNTDGLALPIFLGVGGKNLRFRSFNCYASRSSSSWKANTEQKQVQCPSVDLSNHSS